MTLSGGTPPPRQSSMGMGARHPITVSVGCEYGWLRNFRQFWELTGMLVSVQTACRLNSRSVEII